MSPTTSVIRDNFQVHTIDEMMAMAPGTMSFAVERLPYNYYAFGDYIRKETMVPFRVMREDIYYEYALYVTRNGWYMKNHLDEFILIVQQSGIQKYWLMVTTYKQLDHFVQRSIELSNMHQGGEAKPLEIRQVEGMFIMLTIGLAVSLVIFVAELVFGRLTCK